MVMDRTSEEQKKVDVSFTFIEDIFQSGLTLVSSTDKITIKIEKKKGKTHIISLIKFKRIFLI